MISPNKTIISSLAAICVTAGFAWAQGIEPYPNAITDRAIHQETPMPPPPLGTVVTDPDFGSRILRVTDASTNFKLPGTALTTSVQATEWSADTSKFYVQGHGGQVLAFGFDPSTMTVESLSGAAPGKALLLPLRPGPSFSFVDPDLIYGTISRQPLTIRSYQFSTGELSTVVDTRTCGVQPPLGSGPPQVVSDDDVNLSLNDERISISEGGPESGKHMFVIVYDKKLGCRWYNTQTNEMGGEWGPSGAASINQSYLIRHAYLARSGEYIWILTNDRGSYFWDVGTLNVTACPHGTGLECAGYGVVGYNSWINGPGILGNMQIVKRPVNYLQQITSLVYPLPKPSQWGQPEHFTWNNVDMSDSVPVCGSTYNYEGDPEITQPFDAEIWCVETDGLVSTVWRFAHNRSIWVAPYFNTQPLGNVSREGRFLLFNSDWDLQLGTDAHGRPRSDVFIVKLQ